MRIALVVAVAMLVACDKPPAAPSYVIADYAKDRDGDCAITPAGAYDERAKSPKGLEELAFLACRYNARAEYHIRQSIDGNRDAYGPSIRCGAEGKAALEAMRRVGVTSLDCEGQRQAKR